MNKVILKRDFYEHQANVQMARYQYTDADNKTMVVYQTVCNDVRHAGQLDKLAVAQAKIRFKGNPMAELEVEIK